MNNDIHYNLQGIYYMSTKCVIEINHFDRHVDGKDFRNHSVNLSSDKVRRIKGETQVLVLVPVANTMMSVMAQEVVVVNGKRLAVVEPEAFYNLLEKISNAILTTFN